MTHCGGRIVGTVVFGEISPESCLLQCLDTVWLKAFFGGPDKVILSHEPRNGQKIGDTSSPREGFVWAFPPSGHCEG